MRHKLSCKKVCIFVLVFICFTLTAQEKNPKINYFSSLQSETKAFIDTIEKAKTEGQKNIVYSVFLFNTAPDTNSFCFLVSYILNSTEYPIHFTPYTFVVGKNLVIINNQKNIPVEWKTKEYVQIIDIASKRRILKKLNNSEFAKHIEEESLLVWYDGTKIRKRFCRYKTLNDGFSYTVVSEYPNCSFSDFSDVKASFNINMDSINELGKLKLLPINYIGK